MTVRSEFAALLVDHRDDLDEPARDELLARRAVTFRFALDLALRVADRIA